MSGFFACDHLLPSLMPFGPEARQGDDRAILPQAPAYHERVEAVDARRVHRGEPLVPAVEEQRRADRHGVVPDAQTGGSGCGDRHLVGTVRHAA